MLMWTNTKVPVLFVVVFGLSRSVTAGLLKAGLVLQIEIFGRGSALHLNL